MSEMIVSYPPALANFFETFDRASSTEQSTLRSHFEEYLAAPAKERGRLLQNHPLLAALIGAVQGIRVHDDFCRGAIHPFINEVFEKAGIEFSRDRIFELIYIHSLWGQGESPSGQGSYLDATRSLRVALPTLLDRYEIRSMVDAGCGDFNWMKVMDPGSLLDTYYGVDIVPSLIAENQALYSRSNVKFLVMDLVTTIPPKTDLIFCRHLLQHLPFSDCEAMLSNFRASGAKYLLATSVPDVKTHEEVLVTGAFRKINLEIEPFQIGPRIDTLDDSQRPKDPTVLGLYQLQ